METNDTCQPVVAHFTMRYVRLTENWIQTQVLHGRRYQPVVVTYEAVNLNEDAPPYFAMAEQSVFTRYGNGALRKVLGYYPSYYRFLRRRGARLLHAHHGHWGHAALPLAQAAGVPLVTSFYGADASLLPRRKPAWRERYQHLFREGRLFLVEGPHMRNQLEELGCPVEKIVIQHLGIEVDRFTCTPRQLKSGEPIRLLMVGRFVEKKGFPYALEALSDLVSRGVPAHLTIVGGASETERSQRVERRIQHLLTQHELESSVTLTGMIPYERLKDVYYDHHVLLAPSVQAQEGDNEGGFPVTVTEAMATGMPVVGFAHADIPEIVTHEENGLLAPERDARALARYLEELADQPQRITAMGRAGRACIEAEYEAGRQADRLERLYDHARREG